MFSKQSFDVYSGAITCPIDFYCNRQPHWLPLSLFIQIEGREIIFHGNGSVCGLCLNGTWNISLKIFELVLTTTLTFLQYCTFIKHALNHHMENVSFKRFLLFNVFSITPSTFFGVNSGPSHVFVMSAGESWPWWAELLTVLPANSRPIDRHHH